MKGILYVVATPIGNLKDITLRAIEVLKAVDLVLAEDTRRSKALLNHLGVSCRVVSCYGEREEERVPMVLDHLSEGKSVALLSDAGTPTISDPGSLLISKVWEAGYKVVPIPGPSALLAALMAAGLEPKPFTFWGFPPRKRGEFISFLERERKRKERSIFYQSPNRLLNTLEALLEVWEDRFAVVARELTKMHEELLRDRISRLIQHFSETTPKGEVVLIVEGYQENQEDVEIESLREMYNQLLKAGLSSKDAAKALHALFAIPKRRVYELAQHQMEEKP